MTIKNINTEIIQIKDFIQGTALPYTVLDDTHINAAYPERKLEIEGVVLAQMQRLIQPMPINFMCSLIAVPMRSSKVVQARVNSF